jgi:hypothetical protein
LKTTLIRSSTHSTRRPSREIATSNCVASGGPSGAGPIRRTPFSFRFATRAV